MTKKLFPPPCLYRPCKTFSIVPNLTAISVFLLTKSANSCRVSIKFFEDIFNQKIWLCYWKYFQFQTECSWSYELRKGRPESKLFTLSFADQARPWRKLKDSIQQLLSKSLTAENWVAFLRHYHNISSNSGSWFSYACFLF